MTATLTLAGHFAAKNAGDQINFTSDTFAVTLHSGNPDVSVATYSNATELTTANGYTAGGQAITFTVTETGGVATVAPTSGTSTWTASGAGLTASYAVIKNSTGLNVAKVDFGGAQTSSAGQPFTITWNASGLVTYTVV